jgi:surface antigen
MRLTTILAPLARATATGLALAATMLMTAGLAFAGDTQPGGPACACPDAQQKSSRPKFADLPGGLDESDEIAALESVQLALSRVGDGTTFVWHRRNGRLSGIVQPTSSFRNTGGAICRHLVVMLTTGLQTKKAEGVACRLANGRWQLEG